MSIVWEEVTEESREKARKLFELRERKERRERIATTALESLIAGYYSASDEQVHNAASLAVRYADALIVELDKGES